ncbi:MAG: hypothetical protein F6K26_17245 [Moorea sp. SIO2I5]|nr:hypothetical protein [Moorena sp. SIO2I5]
MIYNNPKSFLKSLDLFKTPCFSLPFCHLPPGFCLKAAHFFHESDTIIIFLFPIPDSRLPTPDSRLPTP